MGIETVETHHGKHHARYVRATNEILGGSAGTRALEDVIAESRDRGQHKLFNNAAQTWNHAFFWHSMAPAATVPAATLQHAIDSAFGSVRALRDVFIAEGAAHFGSGWVWLMAGRGKLEVVSSHDAEQPWLAAGDTPLLVCDVWEHAYYLDYKNERGRFLRAWFDQLANWDFAAAQYAASARDERGYRYPLRATDAGAPEAAAASGRGVGRAGDVAPVAKRL
jgi:Fe-Mn family superoxide dismutase